MGTVIRAWQRQFRATSATTGDVPPRTEAAAPSTPVPEVQPIPQAPLLFEVAWEVCWQLGGIYTVLRTKAASMIERWGDRYCLIGPYNPATAAVEFEEQPTDGSIRETIASTAASTGIPCHFGRWLIPGRPRVDPARLSRALRTLGRRQVPAVAGPRHRNADRRRRGERSRRVRVCRRPSSSASFTQVVKDRPILAHFHEWMGGVAVPRIAHLRLPVATVFTTHATLLGRYLAGDNPYFYDHLPFINPDAEAAEVQHSPAAPDRESRGRTRRPSSPPSAK